MKRLKVLIVFTIAAVTLVLIMYLIYQSEIMRRYTAAIGDDSICFILYSMDGGQLKDKKTVKDVISSTKKMLETMNYEVVNLGMYDGKNIEILRADIIKNITKNKKYILIDMDATRAVVNNNTLLIRIGSKDSIKHDEISECAKMIKSDLEKEDIRVNIFGDSKMNYNQEIGTKCLRFEISEADSFKEAKSIISRAIGSLIK